MDAPLARALLKHGADDEIQVETPQGQRSYWILDVRYTAPDTE